MSFKPHSLGFCFFFLLVATGSVLSQKTDVTSQKNAVSGDGQVIFSRGDDASNSEAGSAGHAATQTPTGSAVRPATQPGVALISDVERTALTYNSYNFEVQLEPTRHSLAVRAHLTAQNSSEKSLQRIALQLSSALQWYSIQIDGEQAKFQTETVDSDLDHTGQLTEAVVTLAKPLAPGGSIQMSVIYSGSIDQSAARLLRLGAPAKIADASEWDGIDPNFTALRGVGNVIWFPVSTAPVLLGQGAAMFDSVGKWKLRQSAAKVSMHVVVEYLDAKPTIAFLNGSAVLPDGASNKRVAPAPSAQIEDNNPILQVASFTLPLTQLGFSPLSLFVMHAVRKEASGVDFYSRPGNEAATATYESVVQQTRPLVEKWLGSHPKRPVVLVDLPDDGDVPFEDGNLLFLPLKSDATSDNVGPVIAHMMGHAYFSSSRAWLNEGVAQFTTLLWIEQRAGTAAVFGQMDTRRAALAIAETSDPGVDPGQSLVEAWSDIYYRDKAADVLWMLRNVVGDDALARALQAYIPTEDHQPSYLQALLLKNSNRDLEWFFDDWVYRDRGLPDLQIVSAYWRPILSKNGTGKNYLVSVEVRNDSFCTAEVPVTVESTTSSQTRELLVPSHASAVSHMLVDSKPTQVVVNDGSVPETESSRHEQVVVAAQ